MHQPTSLPWEELPRELARFVEGAKIVDCSSSPEARVFFLDKGPGYYLKRAPRGALETEASMARYFYANSLGPAVLAYVPGDTDTLVTAAVPGRPASGPEYLADPLRLCDTLGTQLWALHETDPTGCPVPDRTAVYLAGAEAGYRRGLFQTFSGFSSAREAHSLLAAGKGTLQSSVLLHGDFCLPNVILDRWKWAGFIDVGCGGVGDRHIDLFWGIWSLWFNLKTDRYTNRFLDAYGRELVSPDALKIIAAAEAFG